MRSLDAGAGLVQRVTVASREAIASGELAAGPLYSVNQVAAEVGVSRTPVREAVLGLADAGLVRIERNRGFRVVAPNAEHIAEITITAPTMKRTLTPEYSAASRLPPTI